MDIWLSFLTGAAGDTSRRGARSPYTRYTARTWKLYPNGGFFDDIASSSSGARPAFTLPSTAKFDPNTNVIIG